MKRDLLLAIALLGAAGSASAATIYSEAFPTTGTLTTTPYDTWVSLSGSGTNLAVTAGSGVAMGPSDRDYGSATFTGVSATAYYAFDLTVTTLPATGTSYFTGFGDGTAYDGRIFLKNASATGYTLGISVASNTSTDAAGTLALNTTYHVVASYNAGTDSMSLWIGSFDISSPAATATGTDPSTTFNRLFLRQADDHDNGASSFSMNNLKLVDSFAEAVPEPASVVLGSFGLLGLLRRRR